MLELAAILAIAVQDYIDFAIIAAILICNGYLGFHEELKAKASLDELTNKMEQKIAVLRDGVAEHMLTRLLVPGDVVLMVGGCATPADVEWIEGMDADEEKCLCKNCLCLCLSLLCCNVSVTVHSDHNGNVSCRISNFINIAFYILT